MPIFSPASIAQAADRARMAAVSLIKELQPKGSCEFVTEFSSIMPIVAFMSLVDLPTNDLPFLRSVAGGFAPTSPDAAAGWAALADYVDRQIALRRVRPRDDFISSLLHASVGGVPLTSEQLFSMTLLVIAGGLNTVAMAIGFVAAFLAQHPDHRRELRQNPGILDKAVEELFRRFGISQIARVAIGDCQIRGNTIRQGESILLIYPLGGLDETRNPDPMTVDFNRKGGRHLQFGSGVHTCIGNGLAKREMRLFLEEWLTHIPDFALAPGCRPVATSGVTNHIKELRLVWDPLTSV